MNKVRSLKFESVGDSVRLTSYGLAARGRKYRIGQVVIKRAELRASGLPAADASTLRLPGKPS